MKLSKRQIKHVAKLIELEVSYFNGWSVSPESQSKACHKAAKKTVQYLKYLKRRKS